MPRINVNLVLTAAQVRDYYRGAVRYVVAYAEDGRTVQLPIKVLHKYISNEGISGKFVVTTDKNFKFKSISTRSTPGQLDQLG
jgi:hypothetical protein